MKSRQKLYGLLIVCIILTIFRFTGVAADKDDITQQLLAVAEKEGEDYVSGRKILEAQYLKRQKEFDDVIITTKDWRVKILGEIIKERATKTEAITKFAGTQIKYSTDMLGWDIRIHGIGSNLAFQAKNTPFILVEKIWKGNEMENYPGAKASSGYASVIYAIRIMGIKDARPILENIISNDFFFTNRMEIVKSRARPEIAINEVRGYIAVTLGMFGDPRSIPALVSFYDKALETDSMAKGAAGGAIIECMDDSTIPYIETKIADTKNEKLKESLKRKINDFNVKKSRNEGGEK